MQKKKKTRIRVIDGMGNRLAVCHACLPSAILGVVRRTQSRGDGTDEPTAAEGWTLGWWKVTFRQNQMMRRIGFWGHLKRASLKTQVGRESSLPGSADFVSGFAGKSAGFRLFANKKKMYQRGFLPGSKAFSRPSALCSLAGRPPKEPPANTFICLTFSVSCLFGRFCPCE